MKGSNYILTKTDAVKSLLSYAVGCMFGRYSLDTEGIAYAGGEWDPHKYNSFIPDAGNIIPITDEEYPSVNDIAARFIEFVRTVYGRETLEENLRFIAEALNGRGTTSREIIRNYLLKDFFSDHVKTYKKRPIYWLFDSGKENGFKALIYLHRYNQDTIGNLHTEYLLKLQRVYERETDRMREASEKSTDAREAGNAAIWLEKLIKQSREVRDYVGKISHLANTRTALDLDDGVKVNYEKLQTDVDGKKYEVLGKI
jgi:type II restriction/modification system DNA methylase subunit YeeA